MTLTVTDGIENVAWENVLNIPAILKGNIHVWRVKTVFDQDVLNNYEALLDQKEKDKAGRFHKTIDQHRYISSHAALRILLSKYLNEPAASIKFTKDENNKPRLVQSNGLYFNLTHSADYSLISIAHDETGIDVEQINPAFAYGDLLTGYFSAAEAAYVHVSSDPVTTFYCLWTRKESFGKALGTDLTDNIAAVPCLAGTHHLQPSLTALSWYTSSFNVGERHLGSITFPQSLNAPAYYFDFEGIAL